MRLRIMKPESKGWTRENLTQAYTAVGYLVRWASVRRCADENFPMCTYCKLARESCRYGTKSFSATSSSSLLLSRLFTCTPVMFF